MIREISGGIPLDHELRMLRLSDFDIQPCRGCYACLFGDRGCPIEDDFQMVSEEILSADAYIVASPTYFLGPTSVFKRLTDRSMALLPDAEKLWGKPGVAVGVAGIEEREGYTELGLESFVMLLMADLKAIQMFYAALPGEILYHQENLDRLLQLGAALFGERVAKDGPACPVCGGTTLRFLGGGRVRCMLCSNSGPYTVLGSEITFQISVGGHQLFTTLDAAVEHREWLKGMKGRFLAEKNRFLAERNRLNSISTPSIFEVSVKK
jgi:multimeric flavodoxin WrbA